MAKIHWTQGSEIGSRTVCGTEFVQTSKAPAELTCKKCIEWAFNNSHRLIGERGTERTSTLVNSIISAVEGGSDYWADFRNYKWGSEYGDFRLGDVDKPWFEYASVEVQDRARPDLGWHEVTIETMAKGIRMLRSGKVRVSPRILEYIAVDDIDSEAADCILQAALFADIVYG